MNILKIENNKGLFSTDGVKCEVIEKISKEDLLAMLDVFIDNTCEMDPYNESLLPNEAHQIIYKAIYEKFQPLQENKERFKEFRNSLFKEAIEKYKE